MNTICPTVRARKEPPTKSNTALRGWGLADNRRRIQDNHPTADQEKKEKTTHMKAALLVYTGPFKALINSPGAVIGTLILSGIAGVALNLIPIIGSIIALIVPAVAIPMLAVVFGAGTRDESMSLSTAWEYGWERKWKFLGWYFLVVLGILVAVVADFYILNAVGSTWEGPGLIGLTILLGLVVLAIWVAGTFALAAVAGGADNPIEAWKEVPWLARILGFIILSLGPIILLTAAVAVLGATFLPFMSSSDPSALSSAGLIGGLIGYLILMILASLMVTLFIPALSCLLHSYTTDPGYAYGTATLTGGMIGSQPATAIGANVNAADFFTQANAQAAKKAAEEQAARAAQQEPQTPQEAPERKAGYKYAKAQPPEDQTSLPTRPAPAPNPPTQAKTNGPTIPGVRE